MSKKVKTEYIKFDKNDSLGSYINLSEQDKVELAEQIRKHRQQLNPTDVINGNNIQLHPEMYDDVNRYGDIRSQLPIQSDMWDWYTNFIGEDLYIEIDYLNKTVKLVNNPQTNNINVQYIISRHPIEEVCDIVNLNDNTVTFNINSNVTRTYRAELTNINDSSEIVTQNITLNPGNNEITFENISTNKYVFKLVNPSSNKIEYEKNITYLDGSELYIGQIEINDYTVSGYILDSNTNNPIPNAVIDIYSNDDIWKSDVITSDSSGFYTVTIDKDIVEQQGINQFTIRASADNYVGKQEDVDVEIGDTNINKDLLMVEGDPTPKVLSLTWIDEAEDVYTASSSTYQTDKDAIERYIYKYGLIQFDPNYYNEWSGEQNAYKALIYESIGLPTNIEYKYLQDRANGSNWDTLFTAYKNMFIKLIRNYPSAQNLKVGLFIDNSGSLNIYEVFYNCYSFSGTYDRTTLSSISNQYVKEFCQWIFDNYSSVTSITLNNADNERWINWTIDFINQMED